MQADELTRQVQGALPGMPLPSGLTATLWWHFLRGSLLLTQLAAYLCAFLIDPLALLTSLVASVLILRNPSEFLKDTNPHPRLAGPPPLGSNLHQWGLSCWLSLCSCPGGIVRDTTGWHLGECWVLNLSEQLVHLGYCSVTCVDFTKQGIRGSSLAACQHLTQ